MRKLIPTTLGFLALYGFLAPAAATQSTPPTFLFLLEDNGGAAGPVHAFVVNSSSGALSEAPGSPYNAGFGPAQIVVDPTGRFLYVLNQTSQDITGYSVDPSLGVLTPLPGTPFSIGANPAVMAVDPTGRFLYVFAQAPVNNIGREFLYQYVIDPALGFLTLTNSSPTRWEAFQGGDIASIAFNSAGNIAYLGQSASGANSGAVIVCSVDFITGTLAPTGFAQPTSGSSTGVAVSPGGNFLYTLSVPAQEVDALAIGATGQVTEVAGSPYRVGPSPVSLVLSPSGSFVYVVNFSQKYQGLNPATPYEGSISGFAANSVTGALAVIPGSPFPAGINPASIAIDPTGTYAYVVSTNYQPGSFASVAQIQDFAIDPTSGALAALPAPWLDTKQSVGAQVVISSGAAPPDLQPTVSSLSPASVAGGGPPFTLQINGTNFVPSSRAYFSGQPRPTVFVSSTQLNVSIPAADISNGGTAPVFVFNPLPGGASQSVPFAITSALPVLTSVSPTSVIAGSRGLTVSAIGSNFLTSSVVNFNGVPAALSIYLSPTVVRGEIDPAQYVSPGTATVTVTNPPNGSFPGGTSNALTIPIVPAPPTFAVTGLSPSTAQAGGPGFTLTLTGTGFVSGAQVSFGLSNEATTFVSSTQLTAAIPASAIAVAGNPYVVVTNPGGPPSAPLTFPINNPMPGGNNVSPPSLPAGASALTLDVFGTGFIAPDASGLGGSIVFVNGTPRPTKFVSSTLLQVTLLASDLSQGGTLNITVVNPPPGGGVSPAIHFIVEQDSLGLGGSSGQATVTAGATATIPLTYTSSSGTIPDSVHFVVTSVAPHAIGMKTSFAPSATMAAGPSPLLVTLTVVTQARSSTPLMRLPRPFSPALLELCLICLASLMIPVCLREQRARMARLAPQLLLLILLCMLGTLAACAGAGVGVASGNNSGSSSSGSNSGSGSGSSTQTGSSTGTQAGTYTITITATSAGVTHNVSVPLTVM